MKEKVSRVFDRVKVVYDEDRWELLSSLREKARKVLKTLMSYQIDCYVHGSVARGDVDEGSDVDIVIFHVVPSYLVEIALKKCFSSFSERKIVQATPNSCVKAYISLEENVWVAFPLSKFSLKEEGFYKFGGLLDLEGIEGNLRVPGVDKRLVLIEPWELGHVESSIIGRETEVARLLGVPLDVVLERERVLLRRNGKGRTGVFVEVSLDPEDSFEKKLRELARRNPHLRNVLLKK